MAGVKVLHDGRAIGSWTDTSRALSSMDPYIYQINKNIFNLNFFPFAISNFKRRLCSSLAAFNKQTNKTKMGRRIVSKGTSEKVQSLKCINKTICLHHAKENEAPRQRQAKCIRRTKSEGAKKKQASSLRLFCPSLKTRTKRKSCRRQRERSRVIVTISQQKRRRRENTSRSDFLRRQRFVTEKKRWLWGCRKRPTFERAVLWWQGGWIEPRWVRCVRQSLWGRFCHVTRPTHVVGWKRKK